MKHILLGLFVSIIVVVSVSIHLNSVQPRIEELRRDLEQAQHVAVRQRYLIDELRDERQVITRQVDDRLEILEFKRELDGHDRADILRWVGDLQARADRRLEMLESQPDFEAMVNATVRVYDSSKQGWGSGVFINDNVVLTAGHVVDMSDEFIIEYQGKDYQVLKTYRDPDSDLGMLLTEEIQEGHIAQMMDAAELHLGQAVFAVGTPLGDRWHMNLTGGIISNIRRDLTTDPLMVDDPGWSYLVGYDAFGGPGCSGGPVFTSDGKLVLLCVMGESQDGSGLVMGQPVFEIFK